MIVVGNLIIFYEKNEVLLTDIWTKPILYMKW